ncbi:MAG: hypothetical protein E6I43_09355 [Chloroflexi bacterium]|nr:MAG: hypothetical protein E6I43_09355 [Chloroflexota bacterium]
MLLVVGVAALAAGCGVPTPAAPTANEVLAKPQQSDLKDAHFTVTGKITDNGTTVDLVGDGALAYKPKLAGRFKFTTNVGGQEVTIQEISLDGTNYGLTPASPKWMANATAKDKDGNAFDAYVREKDGYPIKYVETQTGGQNITLTFDKYNTGETITAPPADQVQQG